MVAGQISRQVATVDRTEPRRRPRVLHVRPRKGTATRICEQRVYLVLGQRVDEFVQLIAVGGHSLGLARSTTVRGSARLADPSLQTPTKTPVRSMSAVTARAVVSQPVPRHGGESG